MKVKIKKCHQDAIIPQYQSSGASGFDFHALESMVIKAGDRAAVKTGLAFEIPQGYEMQVRPRSGLALKNGISVLNTPATIDSDYRGEVMIILINLSKEDFAIKQNDRIAQGVIQEVMQVEFEETQNLSQSERGIKGFGSSGVHHQ